MILGWLRWGKFSCFLGIAVELNAFTIYLFPKKHVPKQHFISPALYKQRAWAVACVGLAQTDLILHRKVFVFKIILKDSDLSFLLPPFVSSLLGKGERTHQPTP